MPEQFNGQVEIQDAGGTTQILLDGDTGDIVVTDSNGTELLRFDPSTNRLTIGGTDNNGEVFVMTNTDGVAGIQMYGGGGSMQLGNFNTPGHLGIQDGQLRTTIEALGQDGTLNIGTEGVDGDIAVFRNNVPDAAIHVDASNSHIDFRNVDNEMTLRLQGNSGNIRAGGPQGVDGDLVLFRGGRDINNASESAIHADAGNSRIDFRNADNEMTLRLQGNSGNIRAGGPQGVDGDLVLFRGGRDINNASESAIHADAGNSRIDFRNADNEMTLRLQGGSGNIRAGGPQGVDGDLVLFKGGRDINDASESAIHADAGNSRIDFRNADNEMTLRLQGGSGNIRAGGARNVDGDLLLYRGGRNINDASQAAIHADAGASRIDFRNNANNIAMRLEGSSGNIRAGGASGVDGDLVLFRGGQDINNASQAAIHADAASGLIQFRDANGNVTMRIEGDSGNIRTGGVPGVDGDIVLFPSGPNIDINDASQATIHLDADSGDIILRNADCAEEFSVSDHMPIEPGMVMVLNDEGLLQPSDGSYDKRVVGIVSGAGTYNPALVLDKQYGDQAREPIALMGKVFCHVTAETAPIVVGDLLTTADIPGHAMKASDPLQAFGAVIGKALQPLESGTGLIPVLVALQ